MLGVFLVSIDVKNIRPIGTDQIVVSLRHVVKECMAFCILREEYLLLFFIVKK